MKIVKALILRDMPRGRVHDRVTRTPLADGRVSQQWDNSTDGGKGWETTFLGTTRAAPMLRPKASEGER